MRATLFRQTVLALLSIWLLSMIVFAGSRVLPGDAALAILGQSAGTDTLAAMRHTLGIDVPAPIQYLRWLSGILRGDPGTSLSTGMPISPVLWPRLANTLLLASSAALITLPVSIGLGVAMAVFEGSYFDRACNFVVLILLSLPAFLIAYSLVIWLSVDAGLFPSISVITPGMSTFDRITTLALPVATLALAVLPYVTRMTRNALLDVMRRPYIEMALLKGVSVRRVVLVHALPNAIGAIIQTVALNVAYMIAGVVVIEQIFVYPGLGQYLVDAVGKRDIPVIQATTMIFGVSYVILNRVADHLSHATNPRLKRRG
ncbi:ABC transporter permease [Burkholderia cepacia]|uniref:ABC transporter permease n=1 Tax=Burkholderia cepacia TaxID=292 RepID=UPI001F37036B|nr:ABC transporter permease [Burkholderia cepacia]MCE4124382.1 ABC transporter permease [Burkholderia cepacia]